jgi:hypothetical protein
MKQTASCLLPVYCGFAALCPGNQSTKKCLPVTFGPSRNATYGIRKREERRKGTKTKEHLSQPSLSKWGPALDDSIVIVLADKVNLHAEHLLQSLSCLPIHLAANRMFTDLVMSCFYCIQILPCSPIQVSDIIEHHIPVVLELDSLLPGIRNLE